MRRRAGDALYYVASIVAFTLDALGRCVAATAAGIAVVHGSVDERDTQRAQAAA